MSKISQTIMVHDAVQYPDKTVGAVVVEVTQDGEPSVLFRTIDPHNDTIVLRFSGDVWRGVVAFVEGEEEKG